MPVIEYVNAHPEVSVDVGQVMFGPATTITADGPVEYLLHKSSGRKWVNIDIELETGCGIVPLLYKDKAAVSALQWAIGLELFLLSRDPWRVVLSTDHPNGGSFLSYPALIQLLMDRDRPGGTTEAGESQAARRLGAGGWAQPGVHPERDRHHHPGRPGAAAGPPAEGPPGRRRGCRCHGVCQGRRHRRDVRHPTLRDQRGSLVVEEGQLRRAPAGRRLHVRPGYDDALLPDLRRYFDAYSTVAFENYPVQRDTR